MHNAAYAQLKAVLLDPLSPGGSGWYRTAVFDHRSDLPVSQGEAYAPTNAILVFDGIFLHRHELRTYWDISVFLQVGFDVSIPRGAQRGKGSPDPQAMENRRYVDGQQLYLRECDPTRYATFTINNEVLAAPYIVTRQQ
jgi:uridine kinase